MARIGTLRAERIGDHLREVITDANLVHQPATTWPYRSATSRDSRSLEGVAIWGKSRKAVAYGIVSPVSVRRQPGSWWDS